LKFSNASGRNSFGLPLSPQDIEDFCLWADRSLFLQDKMKILACSIKKYLAGLCMWHTFPIINKSRIDQMLKASSKEDELVEKKARKLPIMLSHVVHLWKELFHSSHLIKRSLTRALSLSGV
jgi:hypothetical protein